ncbi:MAG: hypothetical protein HY812_10235 [Planctomycetes bacterium]|nr:hypothetical protein [Planctomycetota bacterium]
MSFTRFPLRPLAWPLALFLAAACAFVVLPAARASVPAGPPVFTNPLDITNTYFPFVAGGVKVYRGKSDGARTVVVDLYSNDTRVFTWGGGPVAAHVLKETEFEDGKIVEISQNYFAQADNGAVYYFGEVVDIYDENGQVVDHEGSWLVGGPTLPSDPAGTAVATDPAVYMPGNPEVGDQFKPEDLFPVVDETVTVLSLDETVKTEAGKFKDVLKARETSQLDSGQEIKWWGKGVGVVKTKADGEKLELIAWIL